MSRFACLHKHEIYPLSMEEGYLVYAPLSELLFAMTEEEIERAETYLASGREDREVKELMDYIFAEQKKRRTICKKEEVSQLHKLTILPTYQCNFKCTYCYSSEGRQSKVLSHKQAMGIIDYFIDRQRTDLKDLWLAILGGGEPFLSPELTGEIIRYARRRAKEQGFSLGIGLTTNGSIYHQELSEIMIENQVSLGVSFEVLEDIQNAQRQHYDKIIPVVSRYMQDGVDITVKSIITPANVERLEEMVCELDRLFPQVKKYKLQIVEEPVLFRDKEIMIQFYKDFTTHFFQAQQTGRKLGIDVYVLASKYIDMLIEHYCGGEMCLNPEGTITVCHRISSPKENGYENFVYGSIDENGNVITDSQKFRELIAHDIDARPECRDCFVKWHCGGGCLAQSSIYTPEQLDIICNWTRDFTKQILMQRFLIANKESE